MRVLLDECLPRQLKWELPGIETQTVPERGWAGIKNGELLRLAGSQFDVFLTVDGNIAFQQNLAALPIAVIALRAVSNDLDDLRPLLPQLLSVLSAVKPGTITIVGG